MDKYYYYIFVCFKRLHIYISLQLYYLRIYIFRRFMVHFFDVFANFKITVEYFGESCLCDMEIGMEYPPVPTVKD